jgi:hypothetical protein
MQCACMRCFRTAAQCWIELVRVHTPELVLELSFDLIKRSSCANISCANQLLLHYMHVVQLVLCVVFNN